MIKKEMITIKIRIVQQVYIKGEPKTFKNVYKDFESNTLPKKGDFITDRAFKTPDEYEVYSVTIDYDANIAQVIIHGVELYTDKKDAVKEYITMMKQYGWICNTI